MSIFTRRPQTMEELLDSHKQFNRFVHKVMYHVWFRFNLASGNLDNQINMLWQYYERGESASATAHELLNLTNEHLTKEKEQ